MKNLMKESIKNFVNEISNDIGTMKINAATAIENTLEKYLAKNEDYYSDSPNSKNRRFSKDISNVLEHSFRYNMYPSEDEKMVLAQRCKISLKQVSNWFTNKRNRTKSMKGRRSY